MSIPKTRIVEFGLRASADLDVAEIGLRLEGRSHPYVLENLTATRFCALVAVLQAAPVAYLTVNNHGAFITSGIDTPGSESD